MIRVLQDWNEVGKAVNSLHRNGFPLHATPQKNWDHYLLTQLLEGQSKEIQIVDMGCGSGHTLSLLNQLGFQNLLGIDLQIWMAARLNQFKAFWKSPNKRIPWRMKRGNICDTKLPSQSVDLISCISVIEHCVPLDSFVKECTRILKPNGILFVTTDYWECLDGKNYTIPSQQFWNLQDRASIEKFIQICAEHGLILLEDGSLPKCKEEVVNYEGAEYTFIALALRKIGN